MADIKKLIWLDCEMTGLDPQNDTIIEIATIVTDRDLNIIAEGPEIAIAHDEATLNRMDEWNVTTHGKSGLLDRVRSSNITTQQAELMTLEFLREHCKPRHSPMCGNTICQDRRFLAHYMPTLCAFFHYRNLDATSLKIAAQLWSDKDVSMTKSGTHTALSDTRESIAETQIYRNLFVNT